MTPKRPRRPDGGGDTQARAQPPRKTGESAGSWWLSAIRGQLLGRALSPVSRFVMSIPLFFACLFLVIGWRIGPQRLIDAARLRKLTARAEGRIVDRDGFKPAARALAFTPVASSNDSVPLESSELIEVYVTPR